jgi:hypothetical protein
MRKRWKAMTAHGKQPTGHWWRDRHDDLPEMKDRPEMTDAERKAAIEQLAAAINKALGKMPWQDEQIAAEALERAVGTRKLRTMTEYIFGGDEFAEADGSSFGDTVRVPEMAPVNCDF